MPTETNKKVHLWKICKMAMEIIVAICGTNRQTLRSLKLSCYNSLFLLRRKRLRPSDLKVSMRNRSSVRLTI